MVGFEVLLSPSSRRAWIEIGSSSNSPLAMVVALLAEGVDRNNLNLNNLRSNSNVALLAEGVDRNWKVWATSFCES